MDPPGRRNRVWQADFTQFETTAEGTWQLCPVVDYATKVALACPVTATQGATYLLGALQAAVEASRRCWAARSWRTAQTRPPPKSSPSWWSPTTGRPLKYGRLYREDIASGLELADRVVLGSILGPGID